MPVLWSVTSSKGTLNPILHGGGGEGEVVALISIVENFGEIQAIVMKLGDFS